MQTFKRELLIHLPKGQSAFLWGARQTGKSYFLKQHFKDALYYDLLDNHEYIRLTKSPHLLYEEVLSLNDRQSSQPIIIDEIQKIPALLNEVHRLIEAKKISFILCGSSARQLKTASTNLLGGRAWIFHFYPLVYPEISSHFDLLKVLSQGLIPKHYLAEKEHIIEHFRAYVEAYLKEEIRNEGLVRNLPGFARFLDVVSWSNGEMVNMTNIARDCGINRATVKEYYQILEDTLLGYFIYPYNRGKKERDIILSTPKFYLFDVGIAHYLLNQTLTDVKGMVAGKAFEHYILMEIMAYRGLSRLSFEITYWRTKSGREVDFILGNAGIALEIKLSEQVHQKDLKGLIIFCEDHPYTTAIVVSKDKKKRLLQVNEKCSIHIFPWEEFLQSLWRRELDLAISRVKEV